MRVALNALAIAAPDWLRLHADPAWTDRYGKPAGDHGIPLSEAARQAYAEGIGRDGHALLAAVAALDAPAWLREVPAVMLLRRVWTQNFCLMSAKGGAQRGTKTCDDERPHLISHVGRDALGPRAWIARHQGAVAEPTPCARRPRGCGLTGGQRARSQRRADRAEA